MSGNKDTSWGKVSGWYDSLLENDENSYQRTLILPNMLRLLKPGAGISVLDLACGQGFFAREFALAGARVTGVDISSELIDVAKKHESPAVNYIVSPAHEIKSVKDESFDAVTVILAIQNIENLGGVISECRRVLKSSGRLLMVLNHPAFRIPKKTEWGFDEKNNTQFRRVDGYMSESRADIDMEPGKEGAKSTVSFHRPLQTYFKVLQKNGFFTVRLEEWVSGRTSSPGPRAVAENRARKEFPLFLYLESVKH